MDGIWFADRRQSTRKALTFSIKANRFVASTVNRESDSFDKPLTCFSVQFVCIKLLEASPSDLKSVPDLLVMKDSVDRRQDLLFSLHKKGDAFLVISYAVRDIAEVHADQRLIE